MVLELWPTACKYKNMEKNWEIFFIIIILNDIQGHDWDLWKWILQQLIILCLTRDSKWEHAVTGRILACLLIKN